MGSLQLGELLTILVVVLIIFGPDKLPELARRAGTMVRKVRETSQSLREEMGSEYDETLATLHDVRKELKAVRDDVTSTATGALSGLDATARSLNKPAVPDEGRSTPPGDTAPGEVTAADPTAAAETAADVAATSVDAGASDGEAVAGAASAADAASESGAPPDDPEPQANDAGDGQAAS